MYQQQQQYQQTYDPKGYKPFSYSNEMKKENQQILEQQSQYNPVQQFNLQSQEQPQQFDNRIPLQNMDQNSTFQIPMEIQQKIIYLSQEIQNLKDIVEESDKENDKLRQENQDLVQQLEENYTLLDQTRKSMQEFQEQIGQINQETDLQKEEFQKKIKIVLQENEKLIKSKKQYESMQGEIQKNIQIINEENQSLMEQNDKFRKQLSEKSREINKLKQDNENDINFKKQNVQLQEQVVQYTREREQLVYSVEQLTSKLTIMNQAYENMQEEKQYSGDQQSQIQKLLQQNNQLQNRVNQLETGNLNNDKDSELDRQRNINDQLRSENQKLFEILQGRTQIQQ